MVAYSFKPRFLKPIQLGLGLKVHHEPGDAHIYQPKRQTIRAIGKRRHVNVGENIQLYTGMRTKHCRKIGEAFCVAKCDISIAFNRGQVRLGTGQIIKDGALDIFAKFDGFSSWEEMEKFWRDEHGDDGQITPWRGLLIKWEPING